MFGARVRKGRGCVEAVSPTSDRNFAAPAWSVLIFLLRFAWSTVVVRRDERRGKR